MSHLQCPECHLTVPAAAYYLRGDECPRCLTPMQPLERPRADQDPEPPRQEPASADGAAA